MQTVGEAIINLNEALDAHTSTTDEMFTAPDYQEMARLTGTMLNRLSESSGAAGWFDEIQVTPEAFGQLLMGQWRSGPSLLDKQYWLAIAEHIGPDYAQAVYHAAVFMTRVLAAPGAAQSHKRLRVRIGVKQSAANNSDQSNG